MSLVHKSYYTSNDRLCLEIRLVFDLLAAKENEFEYRPRGRVDCIEEGPRWQAVRRMFLERRVLTAKNE